MPGKPYLPDHRVRLIHSGEEFFEELVLIMDAAEKSLFLQFYIFEEVGIGETVLQAMLRARARQVEVSLMVDGFGSLHLSKKFQKTLSDAGILFRFFNPLPFPGILQASRRLHHKVVVADGKRAMVGGINVADKYRGTEDAPAWYDYAVSIEGLVCSDIEESCKRIWSRRYIPNKIDYSQQTPHPKSVQLRISVNDWLRRRNEISASYKHMLNGAHHSIDIVASYFIPSRRLLKILLRAGKKGRRVRIILSRQSDVPFIKPAMDYLYRRLINSGVHIYEYEKSILHAKACVVDQRWTSIGSHNLNHLSEFMSVEMNVEVLDEKFSVEFGKELDRLIKGECKAIILEEFESHANWLVLFKRWFSFRLLSFVQRILYALNRKEARYPDK